MKLGTFEHLASDGLARYGRYHTTHGVFETPAFMPVGTQGTVKGVTPQELRELGAEIVLCNTYHLHIRPGDELIRDLGGLHKFMGWSGPILTDSGGYQVFSLAKLRTVSEEGVSFQSHVDGTRINFTPERVVQIQENLGVDIAMVLDECPPYPIEEQVASESLERTVRWAARALNARRRKETLAFGIVQGSSFHHLRERAIAALREMPFDGFAIGGVSVGEPDTLMREVTKFATPLLPEHTVRYLMGVGTPEDILHAVSCGVDMFDCVIPTRGARFGRLFTSSGQLNIRNNVHRRSEEPIDLVCDCYSCKNFSRAYLSHLIHAEEALAVTLATIHNLRFYERLMAEIRGAIRDGIFSSYSDRFLQQISVGTGKGREEQGDV